MPSREPQPATVRPRWWERLRGLVGIAGVVTLTGLVVALLVGLALAMVAIAIIAAFG